MERFIRLCSTFFLADITFFVLFLGITPQVITVSQIAQPSEGILALRTQAAYAALGDAASEDEEGDCTDSDNDGECDTKNETESN